MGFQLEVKDAVYLIIYVSSIISVFLSFKNRVMSLEKELRRNQKILFGEQGFPNLIDKKTCKEHRDQVFAAIRRSENVMDQALKKIDDLNKNVLTIMIHLQIKPPPSLEDD